MKSKNVGAKVGIMFFRDRFFASIFLLAFVPACGSADKKNEPAPVSHSFSDILGSWEICGNGSVSSRKDTYTFTADGVLEFKQNHFPGKNCQGLSVNEFIVPGSFDVGQNNNLDLTYQFPGDEAPKTYYRVFSIRGNVLRITQNQGAGESPSNRDRDFSSGSVQTLTKVP